MDDWRSKIVKDFCKEHDVEFFVSYEWKTYQNKYVMRKGNAKATRYVNCESLPTMLPSAMLNEMYKEITDKDGAEC
jgi:hypothetical protein